MTTRKIALGLLALSLAFLTLSGMARAADRVALVVGNTAYLHVTPLENPARDAALVTDALAAQGFEVTVLIDGDLAAMTEALTAFRDRASAAEIALFYFAGHGVETWGRPYLIPVDASPASAADLPGMAPDLATVLDHLSGASRLRMVVIDAARVDPFPAPEEGAPPAVPAQPPGENVLILFSTAPGFAALDGPDGGNSPFAEAFAAALAGPPLALDAFVDEVRRETVRRTEGQGVPWFSSTVIGGEIVLNPHGAAQ